INNNCEMLELAAKKLLQLQNQNNIQFDMEKTELIHFHSKKIDNYQDYIIQIGNIQIEPKSLVKWLGIWLDSKLNFKEHVEKKIVSATQILHQASRLLNIERGLSFQAMRQLYIACIVSVADYGVPIWWDNQNFLLDKFQKLQNLALRKILGAFKTSPIMAMELEAAIPPPKVRFQKICMNYSLRIMQLFKNHPIRTRVSTSFPPYNNGNELEWDKYLDWNEKEQDKKDLEITELDSDSQQEQRHRKKRRKVKRKKKIVSQLFRITSNISNLLSSLKIEKIKQKWNTQ